MGPGRRGFRRSALHLRDTRIFLGGPGAGGAALVGDGFVHLRDLPAILARPVIVDGGDAGRDSQRDLWVVGHLCPGPADALQRGAVAGQVLWLDGAVRRTEVWTGHAG